MRLSGGPGQPTKRPAPKIWGIATKVAPHMHRAGRLGWNSGGAGRSL